MRTIKFRGKAADGWHYGDLRTDTSNGDCTSIYDGVTPRLDWEVVPETVGQFTGLLDKNGKKIYEGDIVCCEWECLASSENIFPPEEEWEIEKFIGEVIWNQDDLQFEIKRTPGNTMPLAYFSEAWKPDRGNDSIVVIGNIHDNPELLKKEV